MERKCCICGKQYPERWMMKVYTGRVYWFCWSCYKKGHGEAIAVELKNRDKKEKEWNK